MRRLSNRLSNSVVSKVQFHSKTKLVFQIKNHQKILKSCTMSHLQNEYVVQAAVKELLTEFDIRVRSVPLHLVSFSLPELKTFENSKLGQMAIPEIGRNFGPRYVCKLLIE